MPDTISNDAHPKVPNPPANGVGVNNPEMTGTDLKPKRRAITSVAQLVNIARTLEDAAKMRNLKNGRIAAKMNAERPYEPEKLASEGLSWKCNFSTKPLSTAIGKIPPRLSKAVHSARYLTSASLPDSREGGKMKTEKFRDSITKLIRSWPDWRPFLNEVAAENATYGFTSAAWLDKYSWKPTHFRQDRFFIPDQTKQTSAYCQVWIGRQELQIFELVNLIDDPKTAESAGWDLEACVEAINEAAPKNTLNTSSPYTDFRVYEDAVRESAVYLSLQQGSKVIEVDHFLVQEADGSVSYYMTNHRGSMKMLRQQLDLYKSMSDALSFFSYEQASGLLMGSRGVGRELYEMAGAVDRARNEYVDRLMLSGKVWVRGPTKSLERLKLSIVGNVVLLDEQFTVDPVKIEAGSNEFGALDQMLTGLMDQIAGGVTPRDFKRERVTADEVNLYASREEERRDDITERFLLQVADVVSVCQRRIADSETIDEDSKKVREELLKYMSEEELTELALQPALRTVDDWTANEAQNIILFAQEKRNDPLFDQHKLALKATSARVNSDFAADVVLPVNDPTVEAEQARSQVLESIALGIGKDIPVSPRDNHRIHADLLKPDVQQIFQNLMQDQSLIVELQLKLKHWSDHLQSALQGGALPADWAEDEQMLKEMSQQLSSMGAGQEQQGQVPQEQPPQGMPVPQ